MRTKDKISILAMTAILALTAVTITYVFSIYIAR